MSNTLNFVLASPNDAADKIDEMEKRVEALEAALRLGCYMTACAGDGEYQIKIGFASLVDMQTAHFALVTVLAPEQDK